jgi:hypothetical protein
MFLLGNVSDGIVYPQIFWFATYTVIYVSTIKQYRLKRTVRATLGLILMPFYSLLIIVSLVSKR